MNKPHFTTALDALLAIEQGFDLLCRYTDDEMREYGFTLDTDYGEDIFDEERRFYSFMDSDVSGLDVMEELLDVLRDFRRVYPTPETAHLMEPRGTDYVMVEIGCDIRGDDEAIIQWGDRGRFGVETYKRIAMRNGKPFPQVKYKYDANE
jgi:hypothetical protein